MGMLNARILTVILFLFLVQQVAAHDAWLSPSDQGLKVLYGHGEKIDPYDPNKVKDAKAFDCIGNSLPVEVLKQKDSASLTFKSKPGVVTVIFDGGYGVKTTDGWKRMTKREATGKFDIVKAYKSKKYAKAMLTSCESYSRPAGLDFEIVPEQDPFSIKAGSSIPVKALLNGKPLEGAIFKIPGADKKETVTGDKDGKAKIPIKKAGLQTLVASFKRPLEDDPDADVLSLSSSLTFETK
jgi:nickel transport protein